MDIVAHGATDVGLKRGHNEDFFLIDDDLGLYIVCDGMGGHAAGEVASQTAAERARDYLSVFRDDLAGFEDTPSAREQLERIVGKAVEDASRAVYDAARDDDGKAGMGTTLTMVIVKDGVGVMGHVGDSRLYLLRDGELHQLSEDHTYVAELMRGGLSREKAMESRMSHVLTRSIGFQETVEVDTLSFDVVDGDKLLLCSDGLVGHVDTPDELEPLMAAGAAPEELIAFGNERSGADNITAVIVEMTHREEAHEARKRDERVLYKLGAVGEVWLFEKLDLREKAIVMSRMSEVAASPDEVLIEEATAGGRLYILLDGILRIERGGMEVARVTEGEHLGEMSLISGAPSNATVTARTDCELLVMEHADFHKLTDDYPKLGNKLLWTIAQSLIQRLE